MSLIHWWPLVNHYKDNITGVTLINKNVSIVTNNKLGFGYSFGPLTTDSRFNINLTNFEYPTTKFSIALWFKFNGWGTYYDTLFGLTQNPAWAGNVCTIARAGSSSKIHFCVSNGSSATQSNCQTSTNIELNKWYHMVCVYDEGSMTIYLNGKQDATYTTTIVPAFLKVVAGNIGRLDTSYYQTNSQIQDVRIYDHALSKMEVKELSRGLYVHYAFNDAYSEETTNIDSCNNAMNTKTLAGFAGGSHATYSFGNYFGYDCFKITLNKSNITSWTGSYLNINPLSYGAVIGDTVTRSCWMYVPSGQTKPGHFTESIEGNSTNKSYTQYDFNKCDTWQLVSSTGTIADSGTNNYLHYFMAMSSGSVNFTFYIRDFQMEIKDHATPYTHSSRSSMFYDDSGNGNDGTGYQVSLTTSSNCGEYSADFNGNYSYIELANTKPALPNEPYTIAFWINPAENGVRDVIFGNHANTSQTFNIERHTGNQLRIYYHGDGAIGYVAEATMLANTWTHIAITFDGSTCYVYKNGISVYSKTLSTTLNCTNAHWKIGSDYRTAAASTEATRFKGKMSDFRIYVSALSASDVLELYESQAAVDKNNNIFTNEIIEQQNTGNMVNAASWEQNGIGDASGNDVDDMMTRIRSKYIPVLPSATYYYGVQNSSMTVRGVHYYNASNIWISYDSGGGNKTTPSNCAYVRWVIQNTNTSTEVPVANITTYGPYMVYQGQPTPQGLDEGTEVQVNKDYTITTKDICEGHDSGFFIDGTATGNQFYEI